MEMQDVETTGSATVVTNYGLGARGIDFIERVGTSTVTGFPIYDAHGNNVATLTRSGTSFAIGDQRSYDAWGGVRAQQNAGDPKLRYCANLGHKQDDESGLIYMRARYYEPGSGRFVSEDRSMDGLNWFTYCINNPEKFVDESGNEHRLFGGFTACGMLALMLAWSIACSAGSIFDPGAKVLAMSFVISAIGLFSMALGETEGPWNGIMKATGFASAIAGPGIPAAMKFAEATFATMKLLERLPFNKVMAGATVAYSVMLMAAVLACFNSGDTHD